LLETFTRSEVKGQGRPYQLSHNGAGKRFLSSRCREPDGPALSCFTIAILGNDDDDDDDDLQP